MKALLHIKLIRVHEGHTLEFPVEGLHVGASGFYHINGKTGAPGRRIFRRDGDSGQYVTEDGQHWDMFEITPLT